MRGVVNKGPSLSRRHFLLFRLFEYVEYRIIFEINENNNLSIKIIFKII